jgi:hypothetical protein
LPAEELDRLHELGMATVQLARQTGRMSSLSMALLSFSAAMTAERLSTALALSEEAEKILGKLGANFFRAYAQRLWVMTRLKAKRNPESIREISSHIVAFLKDRQVFLAWSWSFAALPLIARDTPGAGTRLWAVVRRVHGIDRRRDLEIAGLSLPDDVGDLMRQTADLTLTEAIKGVLAALDRAIASMETGTPAQGA